MLDTYQRAAWIENEPHVAWYDFLVSRFAGHLPGRGGGQELVVAVQTAAQRTELQAEMRGTLEYYLERGALPVVFDFVGSLQLDTREVILRELPANTLAVQLQAPAPSELEGRFYAGQISENGRVMSLQAVAADGRTAKSKPFHLIHEGTLSELS
jgi:hypothetical protein